uniref:Uncharacterized protein n=1 Tax=Chenopodium quinoa TaxID=63459 RepID=A0A803LBP2_CHEQI
MNVIRLREGSFYQTLLGIEEGGLLLRCSAGMLNSSKDGDYFNALQRCQAMCIIDATGNTLSMKQVKRN